MDTLHATGHVVSFLVQGYSSGSGIRNIRGMLQNGGTAHLAPECETQAFATANVDRRATPASFYDVTGLAVYSPTRRILRNGNCRLGATIRLRYHRVKIR